MKRVDLLSQSKTKLEESKVEYQVEVDELQLDRDLVETKSQIKGLQAKLRDLKCAKVLSPSDIVATINDIKAYEDGLKTLQDLKKELF